MVIQKFSLLHTLESLAVSCCFHECGEQGVCRCGIQRIPHGQVGLAAVVAVDERGEQFLIGEDENRVVQVPFLLFNAVQLFDGV